jgi:hypothetical protein
MKVFEQGAEEDIVQQVHSLHVSKSAHYQDKYATENFIGRSDSMNGRN